MRGPPYCSSLISELTVTKEILMQAQHDTELFAVQNEKCL